MKELHISTSVWLAAELKETALGFFLQLSPFINLKFAAV